MKPIIKLSNCQIVKLNYIRHLNNFFSYIKKDNRLSSHHISLYMALFQYWNFNRFQNPFPVYRDNIMQLCKIGSKNTYHKCIKELHQAGYITYHRSYSKFQPVKITVIRLDLKPGEIENQLVLFDETVKKKKSTSINNDTDYVSHKVHPGINNNTAPASQSGQTIKPNNKNSVNNTHNKNFNRMENETHFSHQSDEGKSNLPLRGVGGLLPLRSKTLNETSGGIGGLFLSDVESFFKQHNYPISEAQKFFYYNQGRNWMISETQPVKNWQALAHKWMINMKQEKTNQAANNTIAEAIQYLYERYQEGAHIHKMLLPEFCDHLELEVTEAMVTEAKYRRINQLSGSNERSENLLWNAYMTEDNTNEIIIKDQPNLLSIAKKLTVLKHFQECKAKNLPLNIKK